MHEAPGSTQEFPDTLSAQAFLTDLQKRFSAVASPYVPSEKMGSMALPWMLGGALAGWVPGLLVGVLVGALSALLFGLMSLLVGVVYAVGCIVYILVVGAFFVGLGGLTATFALSALTIASIVTGAGKRGDNRSTKTAAAISAVASLLVAPAIISVFYLFADRVPPASGVFQLGTFVHMVAGKHWAYVFLWALALVIAAGSGWIFAKELVEGQRYCEPCGKYMAEVRLPFLGLSQADALRERATRDVPTTGEVHRALQPVDDLAELLLETKKAHLTPADIDLEFHCCDHCHEGFLSAHIVVLMSFKNDKGKTEERRERWRFVSLKTRPAQSLRLLEARVVPAST